MAEPTQDQNLHLPSLVIKNFRGIDELTIPRLGRVTLLAGKNGVGKTTVLDAVRIWAARGRDACIAEVLHLRGDSFNATISGNTKTTLDWPAVFTNYQHWPPITVSIGPAGGNSTLNVRQTVTNEYTGQLTSLPMDMLERFSLDSQFTDSSSAFDTTAVACHVAGPNGPTDKVIESYWGGVALTPDEDRAVDALNLVTNDVVERIALLDVTGQTYRRRFMAKVVGRDQPVPIRTLGDGAMRAFAIALALAKSSNGFLLIDEAENGIHHSIQAKFWNMVLQTAERNNVQVIATTHSWDCVVGFAQAANELEDVEGVLYRIQRNGERLRAVEYPEETLLAAAKHGIEVR